jgi:hypothetical protein
MIENSKLETMVVHSQTQAHDFVQDKFFQKGNWWLKIRQVGVNLLFLAVLVLPILILFNSVSSRRIWTMLYHWTWRDGFQLTNYLESSILLAIVIVLVCSLGFLFRNNYRERHVYPKRKTYDEEKLKIRKAILNEMYTERFGDSAFRESTKYYAVDGEQNLEDHLVEALFKKGGVEIR